MKVGTDGVLLGAWCRIDPSRDKSILDIGTGTGLIALQLAQRTRGADTTIHAIEIDPAACIVAGRNFAASDWSERLKLHCGAIQEFTENVGGETRYDHIISNPPYFMESLVSPDTSRSLARHTESLGYDDLMKCCFRLLKPGGRVSLIVPAGSETERMRAAAAACDFAVSRRTDVHSTHRSGPKRTLMEFMRCGESPDGSPVESSGDNVEPDRLTIENCGPGTFSEEYRILTRDFYLHF